MDNFAKIFARRKLFADRKNLPGMNAISKYLTDTALDQLFRNGLLSLVKNEALIQRLSLARI